MANIQTTITGNPLAFETTAIDAPMGVVANFAPVQDLHGQTAPYPAGGGKNLFGNLVEGYFDATGAIHAQSASLEYYTVDYYSVGSSTNGAYQTWATSPSTDSWCGVACYDESKTFISRVHATRSFDASGYAWNLVTFAEGTKYIRISMRTFGSDKLMFELGSTATDYAPYSNICPISGWTGCNVYRTGVNVWDEEWENGDFDTNGAKAHNTSTDRIRSKNYIPIVGGKEYAFTRPQGAFYIYWYDENKNFISPRIYASVTNGFLLATAPNNACYCNFFVYYSSGVYNNNISINYPSSDTAYHAYHGNTYPVDWTSSAGTVYGGSLDVAKGVLTATLKYINLGDHTWSVVSGTAENVHMFRCPTIADIVTTGRTADMYCSAYKITETSTSVSLIDPYSVMRYSGRIYVRDDRFSDATAFASAVSGVYLACPLATPITYQLTPTQIKSLRGKNNVWTDMNGDISVTYIPYAISRVRLNEEVQIDISDTTATSSDVKAGKLFYTASGVQVSGNVGDGSATMPATSIAVTPSISVSAAGLITATTTGSQSVTPTVVPGFISEGTAGTITISGSNTSQLSTQAAKTVTPTESAQTAVAAGKYTTGAITVAAISSTYVGTGITRRSSTDMTISGTTVTAPTGYYAANATTTIPTGAIDYPVFTTNDGTISSYSVTEETSSIRLDLEGTQDNTYSIAVTPGYVSESVGGQVTTRVVAQLSLDAAVFNKGTTTVSGTTATRGVMTCSTHGWVGSTSGKAGYFSLGAATFKNAATSGVTYVDISNTSEAPTLNGSDLFINQGYVDNLKINFTKLVSSMTLPTSASASASGTTKATISRSTSDQYINIPTGYNSAAANYKISAVPNGSATTPATTVTVTPSITVSSAGLITATASGTKSVTPTVSAGYVSSGTAGTITVSGSNTQQLTVYDGSWSIIT